MRGSIECSNAQDLTPSCQVLSDLPFPVRGFFGFAGGFTDAFRAALNFWRLEHSEILPYLNSITSDRQEIRTSASTGTRSFIKKKQPPAQGRRLLEKQARSSGIATEPDSRSCSIAPSPYGPAPDASATWQFQHPSILPEPLRRGHAGFVALRPAD